MSAKLIKYQVKKTVIYDEIHLKPGDEVWKIDPWKKKPEGHEIAMFTTRTGNSLPLLKDEVEKIIS